MATMAELIAQVRRRTDTENSAFVTDQELEDYLNDSIADLYLELLSRWGEEFFVVDEQVTVPAGGGDEDGNILSIVTTPFASPPIRILWVGLWLDEEKKLFPLENFQRQDTVIELGQVDWRTSPPRYRIKGMTEIEFDRASNASREVVIRAVPAPARYDKDVVAEIRELYAWREYVIVDSMIKVMQKEESDTAALDARKQMLLARMSAVAPPRDVQVKTMVDGRSMEEIDWRSLWL